MIGDKVTVKTVYQVECLICHESAIDGDTFDYEWQAVDAHGAHIAMHREAEDPDVA